MILPRISGVCEKVFAFGGTGSAAKDGPWGSPEQLEILLFCYFATASTGGRLRPARTAQGGSWLPEPVPGRPPTPGVRGEPLRSCRGGHSQARKLLPGPMPGAAKCQVAHLMTNCKISTRISVCQMSSSVELPAQVVYAEASVKCVKCGHGQSCAIFSKRIPTQ